MDGWDVSLRRRETATTQGPRSARCGNVIMPELPGQTFVRPVLVQRGKIGSPVMDGRWIESQGARAPGLGRAGCGGSLSLLFTRDCRASTESSVMGRGSSIFFATLLCIRHVIGWHCLHSPEMGRGPEKGTLGRVGPGMGHVDVRLLLECSETTL